MAETPHILIVDELTPEVVHFLQTSDSADRPEVVVVGQYFADIADHLDHLVMETIKELEQVRGALMLHSAPAEYGVYVTGLITPRIVDNADRSGANRFKVINAVFVRWH